MRGLRKEDCDKEISDQDIEYISRKLCKNWRSLPPVLGMPRVTESDIQRDHNKEREKRRAFFLDWKEFAGSDATYRMLIGALLEIDDREDAEGICELLMNQLHPKLETTDYHEEDPKSRTTQNGL